MQVSIIKSRAVDAAAVIVNDGGATAPWIFTPFRQEHPSQVFPTKDGRVLSVAMSGSLALHDPKDRSCVARGGPGTRLSFAGGLMSRDGRHLYLYDGWSVLVVDTSSLELKRSVRYIIQDGLGGNWSLLEKSTSAHTHLALHTIGLTFQKIEGHGAARPRSRRLLRRRGEGYDRAESAGLTVRDGVPLRAIAHSRFP